LFPSRLVSIDVISQTPPGSFFGIIGISRGFYDPAAAPLIGFALHLLTDTIAGNIFGQVSIFWRRISPYNARHGMVSGIIVGVILWALFFVPVATFAIQPMIDSFRNSITPNQYVYSIVTNFEGLYPIIILGSLAFHIIYGVLLGYIAGRMMELKTLQGVE
jgi:Na+/proline symporter